MPKRSRKRRVVRKVTPKKRIPRPPKRDENQAAFAALQRLIKQTEGTGKDPLAVALGQRGGLKGGKARAESMTPEQRSESARQAAQARWKRIG